MKYLISCTCGHALDKHGPAGCDGDGRLPCRCRRDPEGALDAAIDDARSHPWGAVAYPAASENAKASA